MVKKILNLNDSWYEPLGIRCTTYQSGLTMGSIYQWETKYISIYWRNHTGYSTTAHDNILTPVIHD